MILANICNNFDDSGQSCDSGGSGNFDYSGESGNSGDSDNFGEYGDFPLVTGNFT